MPTPSIRRFLLALAACTLATPHAAASAGNGAVRPPPPPREFRGAWLATVANIDWPSRPGLPADRQQSELIALLDLAARLNLNAIVFQVRPNCDAVYASSLEPWSACLTGRQGRAPDPAWDPLEFAVREAHRRGLELHAWVNPYRAGRAADRDACAENHVTRTRPELVRTYGKWLWLDPGEAAVREHVLDVLRDLVSRYDIDGIHMDDYFYPYPEKDSRGRPLDFPDDTTWDAYRRAGGTRARDDWRRDNVDGLISRLKDVVQAGKPWVTVGLSPFGIWRPGHPPQVRGLDPYATLYADARAWFRAGWVDYLAPQLYWPREPPAQSFSALLSWWADENVCRRHLWPGINAARAARWPPDELGEQILLTRRIPESCGAIHWHLGALARDTGAAGALAGRVYAEPAIVPPSPWLDDVPPAAPRIRASPHREGGIVLEWEAGDATETPRWVVQSRRDGAWTCRVVPAATTSWRPPADSPPDAVAIYALDRAANLSDPVVQELPTVREMPAVEAP